VRIILIRLHIGKRILQEKAPEISFVGNGITEAPNSGTKAETLDTAKEFPTDLRASARPYPHIIQPFDTYDRNELKMILSAW
jgi:hypothetical protein